MRFESPLALLLLILIPLLLETSVLSFFKSFLKKNNQKSSGNAILFTTSVDFKKLPSSLKCKLAGSFLSSLKVASFFFLVIALSRPQYGNQITETETSGKDIALALDISGSMQALDFKLAGKNVDRLSILKKVVKDFIEARKGDRIALIVFGSQSFTQCPLTHDTELLKKYVDALEVGMAGENTAIGDGIAIALKRIKDIEAESKVMILVSDGDDTASTLAPLLAAKSAKELGVKIHVIGIGGSGPAPMPVTDTFGRKGYRYYNLSFNEELLKKIAETTNGQYFFAKDTEKLASIYSEIDKLESRESTIKSYIEYEERYLPFLLFALILFLLHEILSCTLLLRLP